MTSLIKKSVKLGFIGEIPKNMYVKYHEFQIKIKECDNLLDQLNHQKIKSDIKEKLDNISATKELVEAEKLKLLNQRNDFALSYIRKASAEYLGVNENELEVAITISKKTPAKDQLKILTFQGDSKQASKAATEVNGHGFYLVGDAFFTPNYPVGHGLNDGLEASKKLRELKPLESYNGSNDPKIKTELSLHLTEYNALTIENANVARKMMQAIHWTRNFELLQKLVPHYLESGVDSFETHSKIDVVACTSHTATLSNQRGCIQSHINRMGENILASIDQSPAEFKNQLTKCEAFLKNYPTITKQYRHDIYTNLNRINKKIHDRPDLKAIFDNFYTQFQDTNSAYNAELKELARINPNQFDSSGRTPLFHAVQYSRDLATIKTILDLGADPNKAVEYCSIFDLQIRNDIDILKLLFEKGADPFITEGKTRISSFTRAMWERGKRNPLFAYECLLAAQDTNSPLHESARKKLKPILTDVQAFFENRLFLYNFFSNLEDKDLIKLVLQFKIKERHSEAVTLLAESYNSITTMLIDALQKASNDCLNQIINGKNLSPVSGNWASFHRSAKPSNDSLILNNDDTRLKQQKK